MPRFIITGNYTQSSAKGMLASPSDRAAAARAVVEAAGGTLECWYATTGPTDFLFIVTIDDVTDLLAGVMASAASGAVSNMQTQRAFDTAEFTAIQQRAASAASAYNAP